MSNLIQMTSWEYENNKATFVRNGKSVCSFSLLEAYEDGSAEIKSRVVLEHGDVSDNEAIRLFDFLSMSITNNQVDYLLHKKCSGCDEVFHQGKLTESDGTCEACAIKATGFSGSLVLKETEAGVRGTFFGGYFETHAFGDDVFVMGDFSCSFTECHSANGAKEDVPKRFESGYPLAGIRRTGPTTFAVIHNKSGYSPIPHKYLFFLYSLFKKSEKEFLSYKAKAA